MLHLVQACQAILGVFSVYLVRLQGSIKPPHINRLFGEERFETGQRHFLHRLFDKSRSDVVVLGNSLICGTRDRVMMLHSAQFVQDLALQLGYVMSGLTIRNKCERRQAQGRVEPCTSVTDHCLEMGTRAVEA